jgi:hypothetical protein
MTPLRSAAAAASVGSCSSKVRKRTWGAPGAAVTIVRMASAFEACPEPVADGRFESLHAAINSPTHPPGINPRVGVAFRTRRCRRAAPARRTQWDCLCELPHTNNPDMLLTWGCGALHPTQATAPRLRCPCINAPASEDQTNRGHTRRARRG